MRDLYAATWGASSACQSLAALAEEIGSFLSTLKHLQ